MKGKIRIVLALIVIGVVMLGVFLIGVPSASAQGPKPGTRAPKILVGTAFTYQGQLKKNGASINDTCNFQFNLWADAAGTVAVGASPQTLTGVVVKNGLFTVQIDFGAGAFTGDARWMGRRFNARTTQFLLRFSRSPK